MNHCPLVYAASESPAVQTLADDIAKRMGDAERRRFVFKTFMDGEVEIRLPDRHEAIGRRVVVVGDAKNDREQAAVEDVIAGFRQCFGAVNVDAIVRRTCDQGYDIASARLARGEHRRHSLRAKRSDSLTILEPSIGDRAEGGLGGISEHLRQDPILQKIFEITRRIAPNAVTMDGLKYSSAPHQSFPTIQGANPVIMSTKTSEYFAELLAEKMNIPLHQIIRRERNDGRFELEPVNPHSLMRRPAFVVGGTEKECDQSELEDLIWGLRLQIGMGPIHVIQPYQGYGTAERLTRARDKDGGYTFPRGVLRAQSLLVDVQPNVVLMYNLHAEETMHVGGREGRADHLSSDDTMVEILEQIKKEHGPENVRLVAPDVGRAKQVSRWSERCGIPMVGLFKKRGGADEVKSAMDQADIEALRTQLQDKVCVEGDDLLRTGKTAVTQAEICKKAGATSVIFEGPHSETPGDTEQRLATSIIKHFHVTNSHSRTRSLTSDRFTVHDVTGKFAERLRQYL